MLHSLTGKGTALARQIVSAVDEMTPPQRAAADEVIGQALAKSDHFPDLKTQVTGELGSESHPAGAHHFLLLLLDVPVRASCRLTSGSTVLRASWWLNKIASTSMPFIVMNRQRLYIAVTGSIGVTFRSRRFRKCRSGGIPRCSSGSPDIGRPHALDDLTICVVVAAGWPMSSMPVN